MFAQTKDRLEKLLNEADNSPGKFRSLLDSFTYVQQLREQLSGVTGIKRITSVLFSIDVATLMQACREQDRETIAAVVSGNDYKEGMKLLENYVLTSSPASLLESIAKLQGEGAALLACLDSCTKVDLLRARKSLQYQRFFGRIVELGDALEGLLQRVSENNLSTGVKFLGLVDLNKTACALRDSADDQRLSTYWRSLMRCKSQLSDLALWIRRFNNRG